MHDCIFTCIFSLFVKIAALFCVWENIRLTMVDTLVNGRSNGGNGLTVVPCATHCSRRRWTDCSDRGPSKGLSVNGVASDLF